MSTFVACAWRALPRLPTQEVECKVLNVGDGPTPDGETLVLSNDEGDEVEGTGRRLHDAPPLSAPLRSAHLLCCIRSCAAQLK